MFFRGEPRSRDFRALDPENKLILANSPWGNVVVLALARELRQIWHAYGGYPVVRASTRP